MVTEAALRRNWHLLSLFFSVNHGCVTIPLIFATSLLDKQLGYAGSALLYVVTCVCSLFLSAPVVITLGQRTGLALAMMLYTAFVGAFAAATGLPANSLGQWVFFLAGSFLGGIAASILWTAQGSYLERSVAALVEASGKDREAESAQLSSVFAVYYLLLEVGLKLLCSFMLEHIKPWITFTLYFILALLSTVGVAGLRQFGPTKADPLQPGSPPPKRPALAAKLFAALELWCLPELWCLSFTNMTFGFAAAFLNGYVNASYTGPQLGNSWVGYYATATALVAALCSRVFGAIAVRLGSKGPILLIGSLCFAGIPALVLLADLDDWGHWLIVPYILQGCGRAVYESTNRGVFADFFPGPRAQGAFANQMMQSTTSFAMCFFFSALLPRSGLAAIVLVLASLTFPFYLLATRLVEVRAFDKERVPSSDSSSGSASESEDSSDSAG